MAAGLLREVREELGTALPVDALPAIDRALHSPEDDELLLASDAGVLAGRQVAAIRADEAGISEFAFQDDG